MLGSGFALSLTDIEGFQIHKFWTSPQWRNLRSGFPVIEQLSDNVSHRELLICLIVRCTEAFMYLFMPMVSVLRLLKASVLVAIWPFCTADTSW
jgi:hypothetical protein